MSDRSNLRHLVYLFLYSFITATSAANGTMTEQVEATNKMINAVSTSFSGISGERWDLLLIIAVLVAALVAGAVGITTAGSIMAHKREAKAAELELAIFKSEMAAEALKAKSEIAKANEATELLRAKNLDLERAVSPRILEQDLTAKILSTFAGIPVVVLSPTDFEPKRTAGQIRYMLARAGWKIVRDQLQESLPYFDGVVVYGDIAGAGKERTRAAIESLVAVLNENGVVSRSGFPLSEGKSITVVVGPKPLPQTLQIRPEGISSDKRGNGVYGNILE